MAGPFDWVSLGLSGLASLGYSTGLFETPEEKAARIAAEEAEKERQYREARRLAALRFLTANLKQFQEPEYQFDPEKYSDILGAIQEEQARKEKGLRNMLALQGIGRSGIATELAGRQARRLATDYSRLLTRLRREGEQQAWKRAMQKYLTEMDRLKLLAQYQ